MGYIPEEVVEEVLQKADIVQFVSEYVLLKKQGKNYFGLCPFHQEDTPSFSVTPDKQIFYCFGCNTGGNVLKFLMLKEGLSYPEAIRRAAQKVGVSIPEDNRGFEQKNHRSEYKIIAAAGNVYHKVLFTPRGETARRYLKERGISDEMVRAFQIGYAPAGWDNLIKHMVSKGIKASELELLGLAVKNRRGTAYYDRFRNRITLPIYDAAGRMVGFGSRALDDSKPKYLNTPETPFFNKRHLLYGLHLAKEAIREKGFAVVVEGYMDVIAAHQYGVKNVVASLGTALTREQVKLLMRYTEEIVIAYDADAAGINAAVRGLDLVQQLGCRVKILQIPQGKDPDEYIRANGAEKWSNLVKNAYNLIDYKLQAAFKKGFPASAVEKTAVLKQVLPNLQNIKNPIEREESIKKVASALNLSWEVVLSELKTFNAKHGENRLKTDKYVKSKDNIKPIDAAHQAEYLLLGLILTDYNLFSIAKKEITPEYFQNNHLKSIFGLLIQSDGADISNPVRLMPKLDDGAQLMLSRLLSEEIPGHSPVDILCDCIKTIKSVARKKQEEQILYRLKEAESKGDQQLVTRLLKELQQLYHNINSDLP